MGNGFENFDNPGYYYGEFGNAEYGMEILSGVLGFTGGVVFVLYLVMLAFSVVSYVLSSIGIYTIAKRRCIRYPWLAWIPIGNIWSMGCIADQYQYVTKGRIRNRRKMLLGLYIGMFAVLFIMFISLIVAAFIDPILVFLIALIFWVALLVVSIVFTVCYYIVLHDLYYSCNPDNAVVFLVLSIFVSMVTPFLIFACRKKDLGMPPRKVAQPVIQSAPVVAPEAPAAEAEVVETEAPETEE